MPPSKNKKPSVPNREAVPVEEAGLEIKPMAEPVSEHRRAELFLEKFRYQQGERFGFWEKNDPRYKLLEDIIRRLSPHIGREVGELIVSNSPEANAFVVRGRQEMFIHAGLLRDLSDWCARHNQTLTEDKIAMILAHELTHLEQGTEKDMGADRQKKERQELLNDEYDADRRGLFILSAAGYNPREAIPVFSFLQSLGEDLPLGRAHPRSADRWRELEELVESPDTFLPNVSKPPARLSPELAAAFRQEPPEKPGTKLYRREGYGRFAEMVRRADNFYDVVEIAAAATLHDRFAVVKVAAEHPRMKKMMVRQIVLGNLASLLNSVVMPYIGRPTFINRIGPEKPTPGLRYLDTEFSYSEQIQSKVQEGQERSGLLEKVEKEFSRDVDKLLSEIKGHIDKLRHPASDKYSIACVEDKIAGVDSGKLRPGWEEALGLSRDALHKELAARKRLLAVLEEVYAELPGLLEKLDAEALDSLLQNVTIDFADVAWSGAFMSSSDEDMGEQAKARGGKPSVITPEEVQSRWRSIISDGSGFFTFVYQSPGKKGRHAFWGERLVHDSPYESFLPREVMAFEDLTTEEGRRKFCSRLMMTVVLRKSQTGAAVFDVPDEASLEEYLTGADRIPFPAPHFETVRSPVTRWFARRYAVALGATNAARLGEFVVLRTFNLENVGYNPQELDDIVSALSREECEEVLRSFAFAPVEPSATSNSRFQRDSRLESMGILGGEERYLLLEELFVSRVRERAAREKFKIPTHQEELGRLREILISSGGDYFDLKQEKFVRLLEEMDLKTVEELKEAVGPILSLIGNRYARANFLGYIVEIVHRKQMPPGEVLEFLKGEVDGVIWSYFAKIRNDQAGWDFLGPEGQKLFYEDFFDILSGWSPHAAGPTVDQGAESSDYPDLKDRALGYWRKIFLDYIRLSKELDPPGGLKKALRVLLEKCPLQMSPDENRRENFLLGDRDLHKEFMGMPAEDWMELAEHLTAVWDKRKDAASFSISGLRRSDETLTHNIIIRALLAYNGKSTDKLIIDQYDVLEFDQRQPIKDQLTFIETHVPMEKREGVIIMLLTEYDLLSVSDIWFNEKYWPGGIIKLLPPTRERTRLWPGFSVPEDLNREAETYSPNLTPLSKKFTAEEYVVEQRGGLIYRHLAEQGIFLASGRESALGRANSILELMPERADWRDRLLEKAEGAIAERHGFVLSGDRVEAAGGLRNALREDAQELYEFYLRAIPALVDKEQARLWGRRADCLYEAALRRKDEDFPRELRRVLAQFPEASFARDEALWRLGDSELVGGPAEADEILSRLFAATRRSATEGERQQQSRLEVVNSMLAKLGRGERRDFLLWIMGASRQPPLTWRAFGGVNRCSVEEVPGMIFGITAEERQELLSRLLYGENGVLDPRRPEDQEIFEDFIRQSFEHIFPAGAEFGEKGRKILEKIYQTVMESYDSHRRAQIVISMIEILKEAGEAPLGERIRVLLEALGPVFVKAGQVLAESERAPGEPLLASNLQKELRKLRQEVSTFHRTAAIKALEAAGQFERSSGNPDPIVSVGRQLGAASIKQVYLARAADGSDTVEKVRRPAIGKHLEEDLRVLDEVVRKLRVIAEVPEGLSQRVGRWLRDESDFEKESVNHRALEETMRGYEKEGAIRAMAVRLPGLTSYSAEHIREEFVPGLTIGDLMEVASERAELAALIEERGIDEERRVLYGELAGRLEGVRLQALDVVLYQMLRRGVFHADPHPGNFIINPRGELVMIDVGSIGKIEGERLPAARSFLAGFLTKNGALVREGVREFVADISAEQLGEVEDIVSSDFEDREKFNRILLAITAGGRVIHEGFEKFLKSLATAAYLGRGLPPEQITVSFLKYSGG